jgi:SAM-dependent methyltransferase
VKAKHLVKGLLTFVPGSSHVLPGTTTGGTNTALYCYGVWIKHLTMLRRHAGLTRVPDTVAELGPGDSLGIGLAALLSGANHYEALDVVPFASPTANLEVFEELVSLFERRAPSPAEGFPDFWQYMDDDLFPHHILTDDVLAASLAPRRVDAVRRALRGEPVDDISIDYRVPWTDRSIVRPATVDLVLSHSVMEHVGDLDATYGAIARWLRPGGLMSHQIDFTSHGLSQTWNGYRAYSEPLWKAIVGRRPFLINRAPCSVHQELIDRHGFQVTCCLKNLRSDGIERARLARRWRSISDADLECAGAYVQARRPARAS